MKDFVKKVSQKVSKLSDEQVEHLIDLLNAQNEELDAIMESLPSGLMLVDGDWRVLRANRAAERLIPFLTRPSEQHADQVPVWQLVSEPPLAQFLESCAKSNVTHDSAEFSFAQEDSVRFVTVTVMPLVQNGAIGGSILLAQDITERRQQEIVLHRMESLASLTNLAASVAHEIKNPLGAISIHIQLLQKAVKKARDGDGMLPPPRQMEDYLAVVNEEIDVLNKIVLDFLFAVRPLDVRMELLSPNELIKKCAAFITPEFEGSGSRVTLDLSPENPRLMLDEKLFREMLINLSQNALAAIKSRFGDMSVPHDGDSAEGADRGMLRFQTLVRDGRFVLLVADNGCGMDEKTASRVFEPYYTTKASGTGLGLTMVYKIVKEFRGNIEVRSVQDHGTVFTIALPVPQERTLLLESQGAGGSA